MDELFLYDIGIVIGVAMHSSRSGSVLR